MRRTCSSSFRSRTSAVSFPASHTEVDVRLRPHGRRARTARDYRRSGRRGAPARHGCRANHVAGPGSAGAEPALQGLDSLLSIVQMPGGIPVGTLAIGDAGAKNAALLAVRILANEQPRLREELRMYHDRQRDQVLSACDL